MKTKLLIHRKFTRGKIDPRIYGSFVEHMGRVVYSGIYEPGHPNANAKGFREDVLQLVREMGVTAVRYPGGNFVSNYDWMDGVGPRSQRPRRMDLAWRSIETNEFGTDEFMQWSAEAGITPIISVNLGTKGIESALSLLEYCNAPAGSFYSDLRRSFGREEPYGIQTWCLGNEMDGDWQIGHKTAHEYGRLACETGKAMKLLDPSIELVVCGSSMSTNSTFGEWERIVLSHTYDCADYISLHQYYGGQEKGTAAFLAQSLDMDRYIHTVVGICDAVGVCRHSPKKVNICFDEWGVWSTPATKMTEDVNHHPWQTAPSLSEQIYSMEDALLFAEMLMCLLRHGDRVRIACQSLLTNVSACIMTEKGGGVWVQPVFYPFALMAHNGCGVIMDTRAEGDTYEAIGFSQVAFVDHLAVWSEDGKTMALFLVNRDDCAREVEFEFQMFTSWKVVKSVVLYHADRKADNQINHDEVRPKDVQNWEKEQDRLCCELLPLSFQMIKLSLY